MQRGIALGGTVRRPNPLEDGLAEGKAAPYEHRRHSQRHEGSERSTAIEAPRGAFERSS